MSGTRPNNNFIKKSTEWETIFNSITDMVSIQDKEYNFVMVNRAFADRFHMNPENFIGKKCYQVVHGKNEPWTECPHARSLKTLEPAREVYFEPTLNIHIEISTSPILMENGSLTGTVHIMKDITKRVWAEKAFKGAILKSKKESEFSNAILDTAGALVVVFDREGHIMRYNRACTRLTGYSLEEVQGKKIWNCLTVPEEKERVQKEFNTMISGFLVKTSKSIWKGKDGRLHHISWKNTVLLDNDDFTEYIVCIGIDITDQKMTMEALEKEEEMLKGILNATREAVLLLDSEGKVITLNEATAKNLKKHKNEIIGNCIYDLLPPDVAKKRMEEVKKVIISGKPVRFTDTRKGRWFDQSLYPIKDHEGKVVQLAVFAKEITEQKNTEKEKESIENQLHEAEKLAQLGQFTSSISHELNNSLDILLTKVFLLQQCLPEADQNPTVWEYIVTMKQQLFQLSHLSKDILQYVKPRSIVMETIALDIVLNQVVESFADQHDPKIRFKCDFASHLPPVKGDRLGLEIVFKNIVRNGIESLRDRGEISITVRKSRGDTVEVCIKDTGKGISKKNMKKVFDPFFSTKRELGGTGLGLPMCKRIIESQKGAIVVESVWNKGTTVFIRIPAWRGEVANSKSQMIK